jgi:hypothetical protein
MFEIFFAQLQNSLPKLEVEEFSSDSVAVLLAVLLAGIRSDVRNVEKALQESRRRFDIAVQQAGHGPLGCVI